MWVIWPRRGGSVSIVYDFGRVALLSSDPNWVMRYEPSASEAGHDPD